LEDLKADHNAPCQGIVIESKVDPRRGITAALVIKNGTLKFGDEISTPSAVGKVKILEDFLGRPIKQATFSSPILVVGFEKIPQMGEEFLIGPRNLVEQNKTTLPATVRIERQNGLVGVPQKENIKLFLKADVSGSLEALAEVVKALENENNKIVILSTEVGEISESDVKAAFSNEAKVIGFKVKAKKEAEILARSLGVQIIASDVIYELLQNLEKTIKEIEASKIEKTKGVLEILAVFNIRNISKQVVGGKILEGIFKKGSKLEIWRQLQKIGAAKILNLQTNKIDVAEAKVGQECGLLLNADIIIKTGDQLKAV